MKLPKEYRHPHPNDDLLKQLGMVYYKITYLDNLVLTCLANDGNFWEQLSVTIHEQGKRPVRTPAWEEMCFVKDLFWSEEEAVMQLHPPKSQWISNHPHCLHLWRPVGVNIPLPPSTMIGVKELNDKF